MESQIKKKESSSGVVLLSILAIIVIAYFLIYPSITKIKDLNIKLGAKTEEISSMQDKITALGIMKSALLSQQTTANKLSLAVPSNDQMPELITELDSMANASGLKIGSILPSQESIKTATSISVGLKGDYSGLVRFLTLLENNIRPINVKTINLVSGTKDNASILSFTLGLQALKTGGN